MKIIRSISEMQAISTEHKSQGQTVALVPTMGYLHEGHSSLMLHAKEKADIVIVSLFVNPTQFAQGEDFDSYPQDFERDKVVTEEIGVDYLFMPIASEMYPEGYSSSVVISGISKKFEGSTRPTHFNGVATVVAKLFNSCLPDIAIFGQKDYQQTLVIKRFTKDLNFPVEVIIVPTKREKDGLAMSSRNVYLSEQERREATILYKSLAKASEAVQKGERNRKIINDVMLKSLKSIANINPDYACAADADTFDEPEEFASGQRIVLIIAVYLGKTRLIDNALITLP
ncbi:MAG: pantoate--beta-alanine ligase [Chlorobi bacterium]|nr:pantoate--beta-alanine ligase [Chlorobiota bacterium]